MCVGTVKYDDEFHMIHTALSSEMCFMLVQKCFCFLFRLLQTFGQVGRLDDVRLHNENNLSGLDKVWKDYGSDLGTCHVELW